MSNMSSAEDDSDYDERRRSSSKKSSKRDRREKSKKSSDKKQRSKKRRRDRGNDDDDGSDSESDYSSGDDHRKKKRRKSSSTKKRDKEKKREKKERKKEKKREKKRLKSEAAEKEAAEAAANGLNFITDKDYFLKSTEFRVWLQENHRKFMDKVDSKKLRKKYFPKFIKAWNSQSLDKKYYDGLNSSGIEERLTKHTWKFKLDTKTAEELMAARDTVDTETFHPKDSEPIYFRGSTLRPPQNDKQKKPNPRPSGRKRDETDAERLDRRHEERQVRRYDEKKHRRRVRETLDELVPKPDPGSREAQLEKRRQKNQYTRKRSASPEVSGRDLMGAGGGEFQRKLNNRRQYRDRKEAKMQTRVDAYQKKENSTMDSLRALMEKNKHKY